MRIKFLKEKEMETKTIIDTYKRYLRTFQNCTDAELFFYYKKIMDFIEQNTFDDELGFMLTFHCIGINVKKVKKRGIKIKDFSNGDWDAVAAKKGCKLIENMKRYDFFILPDTYKVNFYNFLALTKEQSPYVQLFLYLNFYNRLGGKLFEVTMREVEEIARVATEAEDEGLASSPIESEESEGENGIQEATTARQG